MKYSLLVIALCLFLSANISFAQIYKWVDENGHTQFSDKPHPEAQEVKKKIENKQSDNASKAAANRKQRVAITHQSLLNSNVLKLRSMLMSKEFSMLNKAIVELDLSYKSNELSEDAYFTAFDAFDIKSEELISIFDLWITSTPHAYQPYLARGIYQYHIGWLYRGGKWSSEVSDAKKLKLSEYLSKASDDILKSLTINKGSIISYSYLIRIATTQGRQDESERLQRKALKIAPSSYNIRAEHLRALTPRWGGSVEAMQQYLAELSQVKNKYPHLRTLEGYIYREAGDMQALGRSYNSANDLFNKSLEFGEHHGTLFRRGKNNNRRKEYTASLRDLNSAIALNYEKPLYYYWRANTFIELEEFDKAMNDIQAAIQLDPYENDFKSKRKWLSAKFNVDAYNLRENQKNESAIDKYTKAILLNPDNGDLYQGRARAYIQERDLSSALNDMKKAIDVDPDNFHHYALIDYILYKSKEYDQIIRYWNQYIKHHPDDGRAYVEVGGAYFHKGDMQSALKYAKKSADLGNLEGIEAYEKFKHMIQ